MQLLNTFFRPNCFCVNLLTRSFCRRHDKNPKKARVVGGGGIFSRPARHTRQAFRRNASPKTGGKRSIGEKKRDLHSLRAAEDALADAVLDVFYFQEIPVSRKPMLRYETCTRRHCSVR